MNPLTELHERLAYSAVAGTALLEDDFRLKKLMDGFAPLAQKNPVFAKLYAGLQKLFAADETARGKILLDLLGLTDAVLYTQAGSGKEGDFAPLPDGDGAHTVQQIRYSALEPLVKALTTTGSGRMEVLSDAVREHPEYLCDHRVIAALIGDLNDPYGEMAVLVFHILKGLATGEPVYSDDIVEGVAAVRAYTLPTVDRGQLLARLKRGFDPEGKTDMLRRIMLISEVAGADENDWYLSLLDTAKKDIRGIVVYSLGYREENIPLLLELAKKERGKAREMACRALVQWETPEVIAFLEQILEKNPKLAVCLRDTTSDVYGDLAAKGLRNALDKIMDEPHIPRKQMDDTITPWIDALLGKSSADVIAFYAWLFAQKKLPKIQETTYNKQTREVGMLPLFYEQMCQTMVLTCPQPLVDFIDTQSGTWGEAKLLSDLFTKSAAAVYETWGGQKGDSMLYWLRRIGYNAVGRRTQEEQTGRLFVTRTINDSYALSIGGYRELKRPIKEPLDVRWVGTFIINHWDDLFTRIDPKTMSEEWKQRAGAYFYQEACTVRKGGYYLGVLHTLLFRMIEYGWQKFENILVAQCQSFYNVSEYYIRDMFTVYQDLLGRERTIEEARRVVAFYRSTTKNGSKRDQMIADILKDNGFLPADG